jgi:hypothetical protein
MNIITDMWQYAEAAVHEDKCVEFEPIKNAACFFHAKTDLSYSYIAQFPKRAIISFRGTKNNIESWIKNFSALPLVGDKQINHFKSSLIHTTTNQPGIIHNGFYSIWEQSKKMVDDFISSIQPQKFSIEGYKIIVTGMSQGGAIATICARHLAKNRNIVPDLVTFGAPAQGTKEYVHQVNSLLTTHYRIVDGYDIVPTLPPEIAGFLHSGCKVELLVPWWHKYFYRIRDHFYSSYTKGLLKRFKNPEDQEALKEVLKRVII